MCEENGRVGANVPNNSNVALVDEIIYDTEDDLEQAELAFLSPAPVVRAAVIPTSTTMQGIILLSNFVP